MTKARTLATFDTAGVLTSASTLSSAKLSGALPALDGSSLTNLPAGATNTPAFHAYMSADQSISHAQNTKIAFDSERFDTDSAFNTTNNRFVVPTAGKYVFNYWVKMPVSDGNLVQLILYKNGSELAAEETRSIAKASANNQAISSSMSFIDTASASDYYEVFIFQNSGSAANCMQESSGFTGFKLA